MGNKLSRFSLLTIFRALLPHSRSFPKKNTSLLGLFFCPTSSCNTKLNIESPPNSTFEDLKQNFTALHVEDLGDCIAIPGEEINLDWIFMFLEEGYRFEGTRLDGHPFVLVQLNPMTIHSPDKKLGKLNEGGLH